MLQNLNFYGFFKIKIYIYAKQGVLKIQISVKYYSLSAFFFQFCNTVEVVFIDGYRIRNENRTIKTINTALCITSFQIIYIEKREVDYHKNSLKIVDF